MVRSFDMFPVLFSIDKVSVSSFGVFLSLGFIFGVFLIWRLARAWDLDEEKILDMTLITFVGGLIGARIFFCITHINEFASSPLNFLLFTKYPGFSFWGGFLGGWLTMYYWARRQKIDFWQIADIAAVGFLGGLILSDLGCFLGSCGAGSQTHSFLGVPMVGLIGKRWPVQLIEAILLTFILLNIWKKATHFHQTGKIVSLSLILIGLVKLILEPLKQIHIEGYIFSTTLIVLGVTIFYQVTKRKFIADFKTFFRFLLGFINNSQNRKLVLVAFRKNWYNQTTAFTWRLRIFKKLLRRFNVRFSIKNNQLH